MILKLNRLSFQREQVYEFFFYIFFIFDIFLDDVEIRYDEHQRKGTSIDTMSKLNTVFKEGKFLILKVFKNTDYIFFFLAGTVTAGNSSGLFLLLL